MTHRPKFILLSVIENMSEDLHQNRKNRKKEKNLLVFLSDLLLCFINSSFVGLWISGAYNKTKSKEHIVLLFTTLEDGSTYLRKGCLQP